MFFACRSVEEEVSVSATRWQQRLCPAVRGSLEGREEGFSTSCCRVKLPHSTATTRSFTSVIMFENFRERLHMVQQDFSTSFKTLGDISKENKIKRRSRLEDGFPYLRAGLEILNRFEKSWFLLHKRTKDCAQVAESVDGDIVMLTAHWERKKAALTHLQEQLQSLPDFITELDSITANIAHLEGDFEEMESRLLYLETLCCQCEQQAVKSHHLNQLEGYKKKKRKELELLEAELNCEHAQRAAEMEQAMRQKLRERQKVYEDAFNHDVEKYLSTGRLEARAGAAGVDVAALDQMTLVNLSDQEALDDFLNSAAEDSSSGSSLTSGPDLKSSSIDSLNQVPSPAGDAAGPQEEGGASEESEEPPEPLVLSDEEDVQADTTLVAVQDAGVAWGSDESDSAGDRPSE